MESENSVEDHHWARRCELVESQSARKAANKYKYVYISLSMAAGNNYWVHWNERQQTVNDFWPCVLVNQTANRLQTVIKAFLPAFISKTDRDALDAPSWKAASTDCQQLLVLYLRYSGWQHIADSHKQSISRLYGRKWKGQAPFPMLKMSVNGASTIVGLPLWLITARCGQSDLYTSLWLFLNVNRLKNT